MIRVRPLASDSLGVRSLATYVETQDVRILIDAGVSLAPRFNLMPHPLEYKALSNARKVIREYADRSDLIIITHYHFDHYTQTWDEIDARYTWSSREEAEVVYSNKHILAKDIGRSINLSQRKRGYVFSSIANRFAKRVDYADGSSIELGSTRIEFSRPLPHGEEGTPLGYVLALTITYDEHKVTYASDVQGALAESSLNYILSTRPDILIMSGLPLYLKNRLGEASMRKGLENLSAIVKVVKHTIIDHHMLRDGEEGLSVINELKAIADTHGNKVSTFAEYLGLQNNPLESRRRELYRLHPVSHEFEMWLNDRERNRSTLPPI